MLVWEAQAQSISGWSKYTIESAVVGYEYGWRGLWIALYKVGAWLDTRRPRCEREDLAQDDAHHVPVAVSKQRNSSLRSLFTV